VPESSGPRNLPVDQQIETEIEQMQNHSAGMFQMTINGLQRLSLPFDRQQVLEGASRHECKAKAPA
jgi:hypothetical protein